MDRDAAVGPGRVAVYVRWSTDEQGEGHTLAIQLERCRMYVLSQGWTFDPELVFVDDGYSGGTLRRPALDRLRQQVCAGRVACVVVYRLDRLSRSMADVVDLLREWAGRCAVRSCTEDINTVTPAGRMFLNILVSFAEYERGIIRERTFSGKLKNAEQGRNPGLTPPYGYRLGPGNGEPLAVEPAAAEVVRRIYREYLAGAGIRQIADGLNRDGVPAPRGPRWYAQVVRYILQNEAYVGTLRYAGVVRPGAWPMLVATADFGQARALLAERSARCRRGRRPTYNPQYLLTGHAACRCGAPLVPVRSGRRVYYRCSRRAAAGPSACGAGSIPAANLEAVVVALVRGRLGSPGAAGAGERVAQRIAAARAAAGARLREVRRALAEVRRRTVRYRGDYDRGELDARTYAGLTAQAAEEGARLGRQAAGLRAELRRLAAAAGAVDEAVARAAEMDLWDCLAPPERRRVVETLTGAVVAYRAALPGWSVHRHDRRPLPPLAVAVDLVDTGGGPPPAGAGDGLPPPAAGGVAVRTVADPERAARARELLVRLWEEAVLRQAMGSGDRVAGGTGDPSP